MAGSTRLRSTRPRPEALEGRALMDAAAGTLDPSFGAGRGYASIPVVLPAGAPSTANPILAVEDNVAVAPGGKIVVTGRVLPSTLNDSVAVVRFNADGSPDASFGNGGQVQFPVSQYASPIVTVVQSDGKIIEVTSVTDGGGNPTFAAVRLDLDGSVDTSFGTGGVATYPASTATPPAQRLSLVGAAVIQADGKIVLLGDTRAVRLTTNGTLDPTYGQGGTADFPVTINTYTRNTVVGAALQPDGQIVVVSNDLSGLIIGLGQFGTNLYDVAALRLTTSGSVDPSFSGGSNGGVLEIPADPNGAGVNLATGVTSTADGKILISGTDSVYTTANNEPSTYSGNTLYQLASTGTLDPSFGTAGRITPVVTGNVAIQPDGRIVLAGPELFERLLAGGSPDATFGNTSMPGVARISGQAPDRAQPMTVPSSPSLEKTPALAIDPTGGQIVLAGQQVLPSPTNPLTAFSALRILAAASSGPAASLPPPLPPASLVPLQSSIPAFYDPTPGSFQLENFSKLPAPAPIAFGTPGFGQTIPAVANYDGAGTDQLAAYLPAQGLYAIRHNNGVNELANVYTGTVSNDASNDQLIAIGVPGPGGSIPTPADYEGTGRADVAVYVPSLGSFVIMPSDGSPLRAVAFGIPGAGQSIPAPADYFGTGRADVAVYLAKAGVFAVQDPTGQTSGKFVPFGKPGLGRSIPVPGDYDGSGHVELAVYVPSVGAFFYRPYNGGPDVAVPFGTPGGGDLPAVGDYDHSGRSEFAVYDPGLGYLAYRPAGGGPDVFVSLNATSNSGIIPLATPSGALPQFAAPASGQGNALVPPGSKSGSPDAVVVTRSGATPSGPATGRSAASISARAARSPINQAAPDLGQLLA